MLSPRSYSQVSSPFLLVHSDVWGSCSVISKLGLRYFITFVDDFSRMTWLYLMKDRSEVFSILQSFCVEVKTQFSSMVHILRSDNAREYFSSSFTTFMSSNDIIHSSSCAHTPQQNRFAERKNRHLLDTARCLLIKMNVPEVFWSDKIGRAHV